MKRLGARPQCWGVFSPERGSVPLSEPVFRGKTWGEGRRRRSRSTRCLGACSPPPRPPTALPSLPCRRPPPRGVSPAGTPAPPRGPLAVAAAAARTGAVGPAGVATRPSLRGRGAEAGAAAREGAAFNPPVAQPPGRTRLPVSTPLGAGAGVSRCLLASLGPFPTWPPSALPPGAGPAVTRPWGRPTSTPPPAPSGPSGPPGHMSLGQEQRLGGGFRDRETQAGRLRRVSTRARPADRSGGCRRDPSPPFLAWEPRLPNLPSYGG